MLSSCQHGSMSSFHQHLSSMSPPSSPVLLPAKSVTISASLFRLEMAAPSRSDNPACLECRNKDEQCQVAYVRSATTQARLDHLRKRYDRLKIEWSKSNTELARTKLDIEKRDGKLRDCRSLIRELEANVSTPKDPKIEFHESEQQNAQAAMAVCDRRLQQDHALRELDSTNESLRLENSTLKADLKRSETKKARLYTALQENCSRIVLHSKNLEVKQRELEAGLRAFSEMLRKTADKGTESGHVLREAAKRTLEYASSPTAEKTKVINLAKVVPEEPLTKVLLRNDRVLKAKARDSRKRRSSGNGDAAQSFDTHDCSGVFAATEFDGARLIGAKRIRKH